MKNIFKKNSIIITALAIMIVIAGYLSFTNRDSSDSKDKVADTSATQVTSDDSAQVDSTDVINDAAAADTTTKDTAAADTTTTDTTTTDTTTGTTTDTNATTTKENTTTGTNATDELGNSDISDDDILAKSSDVTDNGELNLKEGTPGEAVLASTSIDAGYFASTKMEREQVRAKNKDTLMGIIDSADASDKSKQEATDSLIELTQVAEKESAAEMLLEAKGFDGAIVFIIDDKADVVINSASLSDQQLAIIEEIVKNETDIAVANIDITPVVVSE